MFSPQFSHFSSRLVGSGSVGSGLCDTLGKMGIHMCE